ncbi:MAG: NFACT RNA binding domain-containing protein [Sandaracinaceae bacterium]|nr:NFACT RNA binding domain-containing protein [Sandaracinaceae bacterium]
MSGLDALLGARVQRIDGPRADLFALTLHAAELRGCLLLHVPGERARWGWVEERPRGEPASSFVQLLRKHLVGGRIVAARVTDGGGELVVRRAEVEAVLRLSPGRVVLEAAGKAIASRPAPASARSPALAGALDELARCGPAIVEDALGGARSERARTIGRAIARRRRKLERRLAAIAGDLDGAGEVAALRERGSLLLAHLGSIPEGAVEAEVVDWHADPPAPIRIAIDPARGPRGEAEARFRRARKLERGAEIAIARRAETERALDELASLEARLAEASEGELEEIERGAARLGARAERTPTAGAIAARSPYRTFRAFGDRRVLVGRSAADNDALTVRVARPQDHWLHARGVPGSHVVVPLSRGEDCPPELLADAAHLAAHFSAARGEAIVEVQHTSRRYVRKPRGAPPGAVTLEREKVMVLRVSADRLRQLLEAEDHV